MLCKERLKSFALSAKAEKTAKGVSERKGKEFREPFWPKILNSRHDSKSLHSK
jgi:hypothetical protein